jgi:putative phage-type endonuclease
MEQLLEQWLLDNRPYTHLSHRVKQFILFCRQQNPALSHTHLKKVVLAMVEKLMAGNMGRIWMRDRAFERVLRMYGMNDQRTAQWHAKRGEMITASEVYNVFGSPEARRTVMLRKLEPAATGEPSNPIPALLWGTRFEPVAKHIYEKTTNCKILDVSCVQHPRYSFLGASPDGLIVPNDPTDVARYGRLVEFKCPMSRAMKDEIPPGYVHQMQLQMECTGIDECEYVEFRFKQVNYNEWVRFKGERGTFTVYDSGKVIYNITEMDDETAQTVFWVLSSIKKDFVPKDPAWITTHIDDLTRFWDEVVQHRAAGTKPLPTKTTPTLDI